MHKHTHTQTHTCIGLCNEAVIFNVLYFWLNMYRHSNIFDKYFGNFQKFGSFEDIFGCVKLVLTLCDRQNWPRMCHRRLQFKKAIFFRLLHKWSIDFKIRKYLIYFCIYGKHIQFGLTDYYPLNYNRFLAILKKYIYFYRTILILYFII